MVKDEIRLLLSEDLSPYKLSLLVLIQIYLNNKLPITQLILLTQLIENKLPTTPDSLSKSIIPSLDMINDEATEKLLLDCVWDITSIEYIEQNLINKLLECVKAGTVLSNDQQQLPKSGYKLVSSKSLFGSFILKICTAFASLKFDESCLLFQAFTEFRESTRSKMGGRIQETVNDDKDFELFSKLNSTLETMGISNKGTKLIPAPKYDLQQLLDNQIAILENYGTPTPQYLKDIMKLMVSPDSNIGRIQNIHFNNLPSYHYLKYLECLQSSNYNGAVDALHQYFDYMVSNNSKYFYHFALISRASLHQYFGEDEKAMDAIEEAISVARENKDNSSLTYILSWLFNFMNNKPELWNCQSFFNNNNQTQVLDFLKKKSKQLSPSLYSISFNFETLQLMKNGRSDYINSLTKSMFVAINDTKPTFIKSAELAAAVWARIGEPNLSEIYNEIAFELTDKTTDRINISIKSAFLKFLHGDVENAYQALEDLKKGVNDHSLYNSIHVRSLLMLVKIYLKKGKFIMSRNIVNVLLNDDIRDIELKNELRLLQVEVEMCLENYTQALNYLSNIQSNDVYFQLRLAILKCQIFINSGNHYRVFTLLIQQISLAKRCGFQYLAMEAIVLLWEVLNKTESFEDARKLSTEIMPQVFSLDNQELIAKAYFRMARSWSDDKVSLNYTEIAISKFEKCSNLILMKSVLKFQQHLARRHQEESVLENSIKLLHQVNRQIELEINQSYN
ncbi:apc5 Anaphase-promoting complex subunit 5 [Candida maltosa Xu316]